MITYERFRQEIMNRLKSYLPEEYAGWKVRMELDYKINLKLDCLTLWPQEKKKVIAVPKFYMQDYYRMYQNGASIDYILRLIAGRIVNAPSPEEVEAAEFDIHKFEDSVILQVVNRFRNHVYLKDVPHRPFLDLAVIYRMLVFDRKGRWAGAVVNHSMLQTMGISEEELYEKAYLHTPKASHFQLGGLPSVLPCKGKFPENCTANCDEELCRMLRESLNSDSHRGVSTENSMLVLTNETMQFGASAMLYPEQLKAACDKLGGDIYILPGSMHELYLVKEDRELLPFYRKLVIQANQDVVEEKDWLSDQVYKYNQKTGKVYAAV